MAKQKKHIQVEIFVNEEWEAGYSMSREDVDRVYMFMDLLQLAETKEINIDSLLEEINYEHERSGI